MYSRLTCFFVLLAAGTALAGTPLKVAYECDVLTPDKWRIKKVGQCETRLEDGSLYLADNGDATGEMVNYCYYWSAHRDSKLEIRCRLKLDYSKGRNGVFILFGNGTNEDSLAFYDDRIEVTRAGVAYKCDPTAAFNEYTIIVYNKPCCNCPARG